MGDRIEVIPYGVDCQRFAPNASSRSTIRHQFELDTDDLVAVFVGGEWDRKGLEPAIMALRERPRWHLVVAGAGDWERFSLIARNAGVLERVRFVGRVPDPERLYAAADAFVFPTAYETFSLVTHEAAAAGLPLLAGRTNGIEDLIEPGVNGWFIERDAPNIAGRLAALEDPDLRKSLGAAARTSAQRYDWDHAVEAHLRIYTTMLASHRRLGEACRVK